MSSANFHMSEEFPVVERSFIMTTKSHGPILVPCGIPASGYKFSRQCLEYIKMADVIEYARQCGLYMTTELNTDHKRKGRSRLYHIVENNFDTNSYDLRPISN